MESQIFSFLSSDTDDDMKKDTTWNISLATDDNNNMEEDGHLKTSYTPGKKGGHFGLPLGGKLTAPDGLFGKKDTITCRVAAPTHRWRFAPELPSYEHITSEIFTFTCTQHPLKRPVIVQLPYYPVDKDFNELNVKGKWNGESEWVDVGFLNKEDRKSPCVELEIDRLGVFVVTFTPKKEVFDVTPQGCLYNAHISHYITVRFPKKAIDMPMQCSIMITPIAAEKVAFSKEFYTMECGDLSHASEFIDVTLSAPTAPFRRAATVKLPLPSGMEDENEDDNDIAVLQKKEEGWELVESAYKFTRTTVSFDVKSLSRFCVIRCKTLVNKQKMAYAMPILEGRSEKEKGELKVFTMVQEKLWSMIIECFPESKTDSRLNFRNEDGYTPHSKQEVPKVVVEKTYFRRPPPPKPKENKSKEFGGFEIFDGMKWTIQVTGDVKVRSGSDFLEKQELQYFKFLPESYRKFIIEPVSKEEKDLTATVNFVPQNVSDVRDQETASYCFNIDIPEESVSAYFKPAFVPEPESKKEKLVKLDTSHFDEVPEKPVPEVVTPKFKQLPSVVLERLTRPTRKARIPERESRVITGKSLMCLSRMVPEGLTLAVHLDLPDSTITGLGFDAISNGLSMSDVTYKILLYWKRKLKDKRDGAVEELSDALLSMGYGIAAKVVKQKHKENKELNPDCFTDVDMF